MAWGGNHFTPLLLLYRDTVGYSTVQVDLFLAFYIVGLVPGFLLAGPLSDRHGRKPLMAVGLVLGVVGSVVLALGAHGVGWLCLGRLVCGASVAVAMVVGTSWIKELSSPPWSATSPSTAARRAALTLTAGFGLGAGASGVLAQWAPAPTVLPYVVHVALSLVAAVLLTRAPETRGFDAQVTSLLGDLRVPRSSRRRFATVIVPLAPWVFSAAGLAYAVTPALVADRVGDQRIAFATLLAVVTLGAGAAVQQVTGRIAAATGDRQALVGLALAAVGTGLCAVVAVTESPVLAVLVALVLGLSYGICLVSGLVEVQRMAGPHDLAGLTGIYYCLTYIGFLLPVALAALSDVAAYGLLLSAVALLCVGCGAVVARGLRGALS
jgi:MFS family permease